jgi:PTS system mannose-specific IIB component
MNIALVRVDSRLVHGQILEAWLPALGASILVVADDEVATDFFRESVIRMAVPREIDVLIYGVDEFARRMKKEQGGRKKAIVLFSSIADAVRAYREGFHYQKLNVGNVYHDPYVRRCSASVYLDERDFEELKSLLRETEVAVELRSVPGEKPLDGRHICKGE